LCVSLNRCSVNAGSVRNLAKPNERTNSYIRQFYHKATFALLSVIVGDWKPSETSLVVNI